MSIKEARTEELPENTGSSNGSGARGGRVLDAEAYLLQEIEKLKNQQAIHIQIILILSEAVKVGEFKFGDEESLEELIDALD